MICFKSVIPPGTLVEHIFSEDWSRACCNGFAPNQTQRHSFLPVIDSDLLLRSQRNTLSTEGLKP